MVATEDRDKVDDGDELPVFLVLTFNGVKAVKTRTKRVGQMLMWKEIKEIFCIGKASP